MGTWRKCGKASSSDVNDGGTDIRCDRWSSGNSGKSSFVNFLKEISECWNLNDRRQCWLTERCLVSEAF